MAPRRQPCTLLSAARKQVASNLADTCRVLHTLAQETSVSHLVTITRDQLRPIWLHSVPSSIRAQLLEETTSLLSATHATDGGSGDAAAPLYLLVLLLAPDIVKLKIQLCCYYGCSHQTALLKFLAVEGVGLRSLELSRSTLLKLDQPLFQSVLLSTTCLRQLILRNIASDNVLQLIGAHCPNLVSLDVSHSKEVTDRGLQQLFTRIEFKDKSPKSNCRYERDKCVVYRCKKSVSSFARRCYNNIRSKNRESAKNWDYLLEYCEKRNALCSSLRHLNIANTAVSSAGILLAIREVPALTSLGEYCHIGKALEMLEQTQQHPASENETYALKCLTCFRLTHPRLQLIAKYFPTLEKLKISEPAFPPKSLFLIPEAVTSLSIQSVPSTTEWINGLCGYLNSSRGQSLRELSIRFYPGDDLQSIDMGDFLPACINLSTLIIDGANIEWRKNTTDVSFNNLKKVQLGKVISPGAARTLLKSSPVLMVLHLYCCSNEGEYDQDFIEAIRVSTVECFYIYDTSYLSLSNIEALVEILPNLKEIGNIHNCRMKADCVQALVSSIKESNLDVQLNAGSHWFSSSCFPIL